VTHRPSSRSKILAALFALAVCVLSATATAGVTRDHQALQVGAAPTRAAQGQTMHFWIRTRATGVTCTLLVRYSDGSLQKGLSPARARNGRAEWTFRVPDTAATGMAKAIASCGKGGRIIRTFLVVPGPKKPKLAVVNSGYSQRPNPHGIGSIVSFGIILKNPSEDQDAVKVQVLVNLVDAADVVIGSVSRPVSAVAAGSTFN
jgi:hypothetical protein